MLDYGTERTINVYNSYEVDLKHLTFAHENYVLQKNIYVHTETTFTQSE